MMSTPQPQPHALTIRTPPTLSPPSTSALPTPSTFTAPPLSFLRGTWHVTHSTLPMWRKNRNVEITYRPLPTNPTTVGGSSVDSPTHPPAPIKIEDEVAYHTIGSTKRSTVVGIDTACGREGGALGAFDWRGKGWLKIVSSHWEVLGWGYIGGGERGEPLSSEAEATKEGAEPEATGEEAGREEDQWMVTWFGKTVFTPAGIDLYSRIKEGHAPWVLERIQEALARMEDEGMRKLGTELFEVVRE